MMTAMLENTLEIEGLSNTITVNLSNDRDYPIYIGRNLLKNIGEILSDMAIADKYFIVTDTTVGSYYREELVASLEASRVKHAGTIIVRDGEESKSFNVLEDVVENLLKQGADRYTGLIALGGGVVGDLTGFAASVLMRGVPFIQVPTSLLAQVDSAVGGKTAINSSQGKNLIGAFHQPVAVMSDVATLKTLDPRQMRAGYAEVFKYALISDLDFFEWLDINGVNLLVQDAEAISHAVETCCRAKAQVVALDEKERGLRALLNLGHTFGHAIEAAAGYDGRVLHGEAVSIGMCMAFDLSVRLGYCPAEDAEKVKEHLHAMQLPVTVRAIAGLETDAMELVFHMRKDKKAKDGKLNLILTRGIGKAFVAENIDEYDIKQILQDDLNG